MNKTKTNGSTHGISECFRSPSGLPASLHVLSVAGMTLAVAAGLLSLSWTLGRDQAIYLWAGSVILDGGVPYHDAWDVKGPMTHCIGALALMIFRDPEIAIRAVDLLSIILCCYLVRRLTLRLTAGDTWAANFAWVLFALIYYGGGVWFTANPEGWASVFLLAMMVVLIENTWKLRWVLLTAAGLIGIATQFKILFSIFLVIPLCCLVDSRLTWSQRIRLFVCCIIGFLAINVGFMAWLRSHGALSDYLDVFRWISSAYLPELDFYAELQEMFRALYHNGVLIPLLSAPMALCFLFGRGMRRESLLIGAWVVFSFVVVAAQHRYYWPHHWVPFATSVAPMFAVFVSTMRKMKPTRISPRYWVMWTAFLYLLGILIPGQRAIEEGNYTWPAYIMGFRNTEEYIDKLNGSWPIYSFRDASTYVQEHSEPNDRVLVWGYDALINVIARRKSPTRFVFSHPLVVDGPLRKKYRRIFMEELKSTPPLYVIIDTTFSGPFGEGYGLERLKVFPDFQEFMNTRYRFVVRIGVLDVWGLK